MTVTNAVAYQRFRLWAGISAITLNMAIGWGLYLAAPQLETHTAFLPFVFQLLIAIGLALLVMFPFEALTGHAAETWSGRSLQPFASWTLDWLQTAFRALVMAWLGGLWIGHSYFMDWPQRILWGCVFFFVILLFALSSHLWAPSRGKITGGPDAGYSDELHRELRSLGMRDVKLQWICEVDPSSVNITPLSFRKLHFALSTSLRDNFSPRETALLLWREASYVASHRRLFSLGISMAWLMVGQFLAWWIPASSLLEAALGGMAVFTSWCLVSLFVFPTLSRSWCLEADISMLDHASQDEASSILCRLQKLNATDVDLPPGKAAVFHPIPPLNHRLRALTLAGNQTNRASAPQAETEQHAESTQKRDTTP